VLHSDKEPIFLHIGANEWQCVRRQRGLVEVRLHESDDEIGSHYTIEEVLHAACDRLSLLGDVLHLHSTAPDYLDPRLSAGACRSLAASCREVSIDLHRVLRSLSSEAINRTLAVSRSASLTRRAKPRATSRRK